ncbi:glyoxalase [Tersicoccus solisilvae]|uniref:Glyoxalase n=1 Tax=Tersicoccus solisilvae TaxID=1882339 RepID=A0ABQ1NXD0_9MICC|nr:VOC family protein [Tersicoccus solisilvae]GGC86753.1 glyoxalase [Tersicoccus solisilvae]
MKRGLHVVTLAVADLQRAVTFYRDGLGLATEGIIGSEYPPTPQTPGGETAMFPLEGGLILSLYPAGELAKDAGVPADAIGGTGISLGHVVPERDDVDAVLREAELAGGTVLGVAHERPWGIYSGYFRDLDGHLWEVLSFLPGSGPDADG